MSTADAPKLSLPTIVDAAIDVADRDGLGALSMRRIADGLGVGAMSLYRHVADKDALIYAMTEEVGRRFPYPVDDAEADWRERVRIAVDVDWRLYQRHPWVVLTYSSPRYSVGDDAMACLDWLAAGFAQLGVGIGEGVDMTLALWSHINGVALAAVSGSLLPPRDDDEPARPDLAEYVATADPERFPHLAQLAAEGTVTDLADPRARLDAGVAYLCAGFAAGARPRD